MKGGRSVHDHNPTRVCRKAVFLAALLLSVRVSAQEAAPQEAAAAEVAEPTAGFVLSLPECVQIALDRNLLLQVTWNDTGLADAAAQIEEASFAPWFTLGASHRETLVSRQKDYWNGRDTLPDEDLTQLAGAFVKSFRHGGIFSLSTDISQAEERWSGDTELPEYGHSLSMAYELPLLESFGMDVTTANLRRSEIDHDRSLLRYERSVKELIVDVVRDYYSVRRSMALIDEREQALERAEEQLRAARIREEEGEVAPLDVFRSELQVRRSEPPLILARNGLDTNLNSLRLLVGLEPSVTIRVPEEAIVYATGEVDMEEARRMAEENRLDLRATALDVDFAAIDLVVTRNALLPNLSVGAAYNIEDYDDDIGDVFTYKDSNIGVGVFFSMPIGGGRTGEVQRYRRAKIALESSTLLLEQTRREVITEVEDAVRLVRTLREDVASIERAVAVAEETYELSQVSYDGGLISAFDLSQAQENLTFARTEWVEAVTEYLIAQAELDLAMGKSVDEFLLRILGVESDWSPPPVPEEHPLE